MIYENQQINKVTDILKKNKTNYWTGNNFKNLLMSSCEFFFVSKKSSHIFEKKLNFIKNNYKFSLNIARLNKIKILNRNKAKTIFDNTAKKLKRL